jgi:hypothetical protein
LTIFRFVGSDGWQGLAVAEIHHPFDFKRQTSVVRVLGILHEHFEIRVVWPDVPPGLDIGLVLVLIIEAMTGCSELR